MKSEAKVTGPTFIGEMREELWRGGGVRGIGLVGWLLESYILATSAVI